MDRSGAARGTVGAEIAAGQPIGGPAPWEGVCGWVGIMHILDWSVCLRAYSRSVGWVCGWVNGVMCMVCVCLCRGGQVV